MRVQVGDGLLRVAHRKVHGGAAQGARVPDLATGLSVKGGLVEDNGALRAGFQHIDRLAVYDHRRDRARAGKTVVAREPGGRNGFGDRLPDRVSFDVAGPAPGLAGAGALLGHLRVEAIFVHGQVMRAQHIFGQVQGKAVGVVQLKGHIAGKDAAPRGLRDLLLQDLHAAIEGRPKLFFLGGEGVLDACLLAAQFLVVLAHDLDQGRDHLRELGLRRAEQVQMPQGPTHDPAQHVAAAFIAGQHAFGDQEGAGARVVRNDPVAGHVRRVGIAGQLLAGGHQVSEQVRIVVGGHALYCGSKPLQPRAGVDAGFRQRLQLAVGLLVELHEDQVPDLDKAVAVLVGRSRRPALDLLAVIEKDLRAGPAGTRVAHAPEVIVGGDADDAVIVQPCNIAPQLRGLVVLVEHGDQQLAGRQAQPLGQEAPGELDGAALEVLAEGEVAEHLEKGVVPGRVADVVQVVVLATGSHALLGRGQPGLGRRSASREVVLQRRHAGVDEQQRRVIFGRDRAGRHDQMLVLGKEVEKGFAHFVNGMGFGVGHGDDPRGVNAMGRRL